MRLYFNESALDANVHSLQHDNLWNLTKFQTMDCKSANSVISASQSKIRNLDLKDVVSKLCSSASLFMN